MVAGGAICLCDLVVVGGCGGSAGWWCIAAALDRWHTTSVDLSFCFFVLVVFDFFIALASAFGVFGLAI